MQDRAHSSWLQGLGSDSGPRDCGGASTVSTGPDSSPQPAWAGGSP